LEKNQNTGGENEERAKWVKDRRRIMKSYERVYREVAGRIIKRESNDIRGAARRYFHKREAGLFSTWLEGFWREHGEYVKRQMLPVTTAYGEMVGHDVEAEIGKTVTAERLTGFVLAYVEEYVRRHIIKSREKLEARIKQAQASGKDMVEEIDAELDEWDNERPAQIAKAESVRANNAVAFALYSALGVEVLKWYASGSKSCPYCQEMDGRTVEVHVPFFSPGDDYKPDGAEEGMKITHVIGHPPLHDGCQCIVGAG